MSVWLVIAFFGLPGAVVGPLPMTVDECVVEMRAEVDEIRAAINSVAADHPARQVFGRTLMPEDVTGMCLRSDSRPLVEEDR